MTENAAVCGQCGTVALPLARFCESCGAPLPEPPEQQQHASQSPAGITTGPGVSLVAGPFTAAVPAPPPRRAAGSGISPAIPPAANARTVPPRHASAPAEKQRYFSEQYAGTPFANEPRVATPEIADPAMPIVDDATESGRRLGCLGAITIVLGLNWLVQGVLGFVQAALTWRTGSVLGQEVAPDVLAKFQVAIVIGALVSLVWILIGVKIILAPGRWSLGFTGVSFFLNAILVLLALATVQNPATNLIAAVAAIVLFEVVMGLMALTAAQAMD